MSNSSNAPPAYNASGTPQPPRTPPQTGFGSSPAMTGNPSNGTLDAGGVAAAYHNIPEFIQDTTKAYYDAAEKQGASSQQNTQAQTQANRPNQFTPFNSSQWVQNPDGSWTQNTGLAPGLQGALFSLQGQAAQNAAQGFDNGSAARQQAIDAAYNQSTSRLDPRFNQAQEQLQTQLANQGLDPNSAAYRNAMQQFGQQRNDAYQGAMNSAIGQGTAAQQATFGENLAAQMAPYQQMQALFGFGQAPSFMGAGAAQATQYLPALLGMTNANISRQQMDNEASGAGWDAAGNAVGTFGGVALPYMFGSKKP
jgi:hypothetical protein